MTQLKPEHKIYYVGKKNVYACPKCKHKHVTVDLVKGTTPFTVACPNCKEYPAQSSFYRVPQDLLPTFEWYTPDDEELERINLEEGKPGYGGTLDHIQRGGLLIRPVPEETVKVLRATGSFSEDIPAVMVASVDLDKPMGSQIKTENF